MMNSINFYYFTIPYVFLLHEVETRFDYVSDNLNISHEKLQRVVIVATIHYLPFVQKTSFENGTKIYEGILFEMMNVIAKRLDFTYHVVEPPDMNYGALTTNGTFNGLIGMLQNNTADIVAAGLTITYNRSLAVPFSPPFHFESYGILVTATSESSSIVQLFVIFSTYVWIATLASTFLAVLTISCTSRILSSRDESFIITLFNSFWVVFSLIVSQLTIITEKTWSGRIQQLFWRLFVILLFTTYVSSMISFLTLTRTSIPFKNMEGLLDAVETKGFKVCLQRDAAFWSAVMTDAKYVSLKNFLLNNEPYTSDFTCQDIVANDPKVAYIAEVSYLETVQTKFCQKSFVILKETFYPGYFGLAFKKNFSLLRQVSDTVNEIAEKGFIQMWKSKYTNKSECKLNDVGESDSISMGSNQLGLSDMMATFIFLLIGLGLSIFAFFTEKSSQFIKQSNLANLK